MRGASITNSLPPSFLFIAAICPSWIQHGVKGQLKPKAIHSVQCILRGPGPRIVSLLKMSFQKWLNCDYAGQIDLAWSLEEGEIKVNFWCKWSLFHSFKQMQTPFLCSLACDDLYFFVFLFLSLLELHPWSLSLTLLIFVRLSLQAQCLWHQVLLFMASQPQDQAVHKTWVSFQGHSDGFMFIERQTYTAASISSGSNPLHLSDFSNEAMNWSVSTAASRNNFITTSQKGKHVQNHWFATFLY